MLVTTLGGALDRLGLVAVNSVSTQNTSYATGMAYSGRSLIVDGSDASAESPGKERG